MAITREQVAQAATAMEAEGVEPTYMNVRSRLGTGSFSTIQKYLKEWRTVGAETKPDTEELPEPFREVLQRFGLEAWKAVSVWARDELEEAARTSSGGWPRIRSKSRRPRRPSTPSRTS